MPYRRLPNTIASIIRTLKTARDEWKRTPVAANRAISADQWAQLDETLPAALLSTTTKPAAELLK